MEYTKKQMEYIDSVDGQAHMSAVKIIGDLEQYIKENYIRKDKIISLHKKIPSKTKIRKSAHIKESYAEAYYQGQFDVLVELLKANT